MLPLLGEREQAQLAAVHKVGYALWQIQVLETALTAHLVLSHELEPGCAKAALIDALNRRERQTFGQVLRDLERALVAKPTLGESVRTCLSAFKDERNWLVHHSRAECHIALNDEAWKQRVFERLDKIADEALALMKEVQAATEDHLAGRGVSRERVNRNASMIMAAWDRGERHPDEVHKT